MFTKMPKGFCSAFSESNRECGRNHTCFCSLLGKLSFLCQKTCRKVGIKPVCKRIEGLMLLPHKLSCL
jgi:hypothetical protein